MKRRKLTLADLVGRGASSPARASPCPPQALVDMTRRVLATLTPAEEKVLRMRFGVGAVGAGEPLFVDNPTVAEIEARAVAWLNRKHRNRRTT